MTKNIPVALQTHLDGLVTTMCYCWRVTRTDAVVQGFTEHDVNLTFDSTTFIASSGFTATSIDSSLGLAVDNLNVDGALASDTLNEDDLAAGKYDGAKVELFWVNWADVTQRILINQGTLGEVKRWLTAFSAELRSRSNSMAQKTGRAYQRYCDADLGDARCTVNINSGANKGTGTVTSFSNRTITASGLTGFADDWFTVGKLTFTSGPCNGLTFEVKIHSKGTSIVTLELWQRPPFAINATNTFNVFAGCKKDHATCVAKFNNIINFQGFQFMPGNDLLTAYPIQGGANQKGGSIFAAPGGN